jgi:ABC-type Na+ efflux pump permease subunit
MTMMPVLMMGGIVLEKVMRDRRDTSVKRIAVIDRSGAIYDTLVQAAERRNKFDIFEDEADVKDGETPEQVSPTFELARIEPAEEKSTQLLELSDRVRSGEFFAVIDIGPNVLEADEVSMSTGSGDARKVENPEDDASSVYYYSNTPTYRDIRRWLTIPLTSAVHAWRFQEAGLDPNTVQWALNPPPVKNLELLSRDERTGDIVYAEEVDEIKSVLIPMIMMMMLFGVIMTGAAPLIQSVLEEKTLRIAEVLLAMVTPFQWMMGKLLGSVGVSLTIVAVYLTGAFVVADRYEMLEKVPFHLLGWFGAYQIIAVLMYGSLFVAVGAACSNHREAQSAIMPIMLMIVIPMMLWPNVIREPSSVLSTVVSLFPPTTPMLMLVRQSVPPGVPVWQPALGVVLSLLTTVFLVFAASRIFRVGILMQGKGAGFKDMLGWVIKG